MSELFNRSTSWIVDRPVFAVLLLLLITALAIIGYRAPRLFSDVFGADAFDPKAYATEDEYDHEPLKDPSAGLQRGVTAARVWQRPTKRRRAVSMLD